MGGEYDEASGRGRSGGIGRFSFHHNGRATTRQRYGPVLDELEKLWKEKGSDPEFLEKYYLPKVKELTAGEL